DNSIRSAVGSQNCGACLQGEGIISEARLETVAHIYQERVRRIGLKPSRQSLGDGAAIAIGHNARQGRVVRGRRGLPRTSLTGRGPAGNGSKVVTEARSLIQRIGLRKRSILNGCRRQESSVLAPGDAPAVKEYVLCFQGAAKVGFFQRTRTGVVPVQGSIRFLHSA